MIAKSDKWQPVRSAPTHRLVRRNRYTGAKEFGLPARVHKGDERYNGQEVADIMNAYEVNGWKWEKL
jgi:hypothetical protein